MAGVMIVVEAEDVKEGPSAKYEVGNRKMKSPGAHKMRRSAILACSPLGENYMREVLVTRNRGNWVYQAQHPSIKD